MEERRTDNPGNRKCFCRILRQAKQAAPKILRKKRSKQQQIETVADQIGNLANFRVFDCTVS